MNRGPAIFFLIVAALLEAGGDAVIRVGLRSPGLKRGVYLILGSLILAAYGFTVNAPPWDLGRLLGLYVVFFFVVAQAISWIGFKQPPSSAVWIGGALIVAGGCVIAFSKA